MSDLPTTSSAGIELWPRSFDLAKVEKLVQEGIKASKARRAAPPTPRSSLTNPLHHIHTLSIDVTLHPPPTELHYHNRVPEPNPEYARFDAARQALCVAVDPLEPLPLIPSSPGLLRIPSLTPLHHSSSANLFHPPITGPVSIRQKPLIALSGLDIRGGKEWLPGSTAWDTRNWLHAVMALDPDEASTRKAAFKDDQRRFVLETGINACWVPGEGDDVEIRLLVTVRVYVDLVALETPLPDVGNDLVGLVLHSLLPGPSAPPPMSDAEARAAALRHFFACMRPAPYLPRSLTAESLQPGEMTCQLHPFQKRTLAMLLRREGAPIVAPLREVVAADGWWTEVDFGGVRKAFRRVTADLRPLEGRRSVDVKGKGRAIDVVDEDGLSEGERMALPVLVDLSQVRGTMLCEEMGLGKTVEAIALILMHRHPLSTYRIAPPIPLSGSSKRALVPVIDLLAGPQTSEEGVQGSIDAEAAAFSGTRAYDEQAGLHVTAVAATLIVTPPSLLKQWVSEIRTHAPGLRVCVYEGWKSLQKGVEKQKVAALKRVEANNKRKRQVSREKVVLKYSKTLSGRVKVEAEGIPDVEPEQEEASLLKVTQKQFVDYVRAHDVVITTYGDLSEDLKVANPVPPRSRRANVNYQFNERPRSPLIMVEWWRVIMDEVQLHGDQTDAANMVALIPRVNSLAVSGTPAKTDIKDLMGSLRFLRVPVLPRDHRLWHRLQQPAMRPAFESVFRAISIRTTKREVTSELHIPVQSRYIVSLDLSEIELHYYKDTLERQRDLLRRRRQDGTFDKTLLRACLLDLRQICTHIQVGHMAGTHYGPGARAEQRLHLGRDLMTMQEALDKMRTDHSQEFLAESRLQMRTMIRKAQLVLVNDSDEHRQLKAGTLYQKVRDLATKQLQPVRDHLRRLMKEQGGGDDQSDDSDRQWTQQEREKRTVMMAARSSIRETLIILHQAWFFEGDLRHVEKNVDAEVVCYDSAEAIRNEILAGPLQAANREVGLLRGTIGKASAVESVDDLQTGDTAQKGGLLTSDPIEQANNLLQILNDNALLVWNWRKKIIELLSSPIQAENDTTAGQDVVDPENEFYARALQAQGEVEAYLIAFAAAVADRKEMMLEERSLLTTHETRTKAQRTTRVAKERAVIDPAMVDVPTDVAEQATALLAERQVFRDARRDKECERPLKAIMIDLNAIIHGQNRPEEVAIAKKEVSILKTYIARQIENVKKLNKELDQFRKAFNERVKYFAALQDLSDSVSPPVFQDLEKDIQDCSKGIDESEIKLARMVIKGRFLAYLGVQGENNPRDDCIICMGSSDDDHAVLLECGHFFCLSCYRELRRSMQGRKCPSCREDINEKGITKINIAEGKPIAIRSNEPGEIEEGQDREEPSAENLEREALATALARLKTMSVEKMRDVAHMDMMGEYGSKINFLIKHLLYYRSTESSTRHVIFSNWSDSIGIVSRALYNNGISFVSFDQGGKKKDVVERFQKDESIMVFLLHAERESSGLTLTSCRVVHLLEPVLRHSFELQAIGRVDRLGQTKETDVYCYATRETVESKILARGVRTGTSIYLQDGDEEKVHAESLPQVVSAAHKGGDLSNDGDEEELLKLIM